MRFSKMHGLGNDFMIVDAITQDISFSSEIIQYLSDRHYGVGFDQLLVVEPTLEPDVDFHYRIFNFNGEEVGQCGNGIRCFGRFVYMKKLTNKLTICVSTKNRRMILSILDNEISVNMGEPIFDPEKIPFRAMCSKSSYSFRIAETEILCGVVSMGNPHCVVLVQDVKCAQVDIFGSILEKHNLFPDRVNVSFMEVVNRQCVRLRVYERGVGETRACGSAACAAVAVGVRQGLLSTYVQVDLLGGSLLIYWKGIGHSLYMTGPATHVYDGYIHL